MCDVRACEARCCYDGVYLQGNEERELRDLVAGEPALQACLPAEFIVDGYWDGHMLGRKTATPPSQLPEPGFPRALRAHALRVRGSGWILRTAEAGAGKRNASLGLQATTCWMFPLQDDDGVPAAPVAGPEEDPYATETYPGYANFVPCGRHDPQGRPWREALQQEIAYLELRSAGPKKTPHKAGLFSALVCP